MFFAMYLLLKARLVFRSERIHKRALPLHETSFMPSGKKEITTRNKKRLYERTHFSHQPPSGLSEKTDKKNL
jgi:hypothetical protein